MSEAFCVCLRGLLSGNKEANCLIDVQRKTPESEEFLSGEKIEEAFNEFVERTNALDPVSIPVGAVDVYIGWWGIQTTFEIPQKFFDLIAERKWKVEFDIND